MEFVDPFTGERSSVWIPIPWVFQPSFTLTFIFMPLPSPEPHCWWHQLHCPIITLHYYYLALGVVVPCCVVFLMPHVLLQSYMDERNGCKYWLPSSIFDIQKDEKTSFRENVGNRIATLIYYVSCHLSEGWWHDCDWRHRLVSCDSRITAGWAPWWPGWHTTQNCTSQNVAGSGHSVAPGNRGGNIID